ncbi:MAG: 50S ribosomal protein L35 [Anaerolineae bacterium]|nr:50S ribosomal protein L35 [Anaerolineae bacterium]
MPKQKTHKAASKRFKVTGTGKIRHLRQGRSHFRRRKSKRVLRSFDKYIVLDRDSQKRIRKLLNLKRGK